MNFGFLVPSLAGVALLAGCATDSQRGQAASQVEKGSKIGNAIALGKQEISDKEGIPLYPGAHAPEGQSTVVSDGNQSKYTLVLTTSDPIKKVVDFYKGKLPGADARFGTGSGDIIGPTPKGTLAHIRIMLKDKKTTIEATAIVESPAKTP